MAPKPDSGPLSGLVVLDLTQFIAGPYGTQYLADLGANVIKVEQPDGGDLGRGAGIDFIGDESLHFLSVNRNKRSLVLDLKTEDGLQLFYRLVEVSDVVVDNFRPGVTARLGIEYSELASVNPEIICTSISAFGHSGPRRKEPGYDLAMQALSGVMSLTGEEGGPPVRAGVPIGDLAGGMAGVIGTLAALVERSKTGIGQQVDVALFDTQLSLLMYWAAIYLQTGRIPGPVGAGNPEIVPYGSFRTADSHVVIAVFGDRFFRVLCQTLGLEDMASAPELETNSGRVQHREKVNSAISDVLQSRTTSHWLSVFRKVGVPCAPVNDVAGALADRQVAARDMIMDVNHSSAGSIRLVGNPVKTRIQRYENDPPPRLGEHTREILTELLAMEPSEVQRLERKGVIAPRSSRRGEQPPG